MSLRTIIQKAQQGVAKAERQLFEATHQHLMTVALRYVVDSSAARDVLQESYIRIFQQLPKFVYENDSATMGWLRLITSREAIRWLKKQERWQNADSQTFVDRVEANHPMFTDELYQLLLQLPTEQRLVFNMHAIEGYSHREIAERLGMAESSSRSLLSRARKKLATILQKKESYEKLLHQ